MLELHSPAPLDVRPVSGAARSKAQLREKPVLHPTAKLLRRASELHRILGVRALHHHALEEIAAERAVRNAEPLVKRQRIGMRLSAESRE